MPASRASCAQSGPPRRRPANRMRQPQNAALQSRNDPPVERRSIRPQLSVIVRSGIDVRGAHNQCQQPFRMLKRVDQRGHPTHRVSEDRRLSQLQCVQHHPDVRRQRVDHDVVELGRLAGFAVPSQIDRDRREVLRERPHVAQAVPVCPGARCSVQQHERRTLPRHLVMDARGAALDEGHRTLRPDVSPVRVGAGTARRSVGRGRVVRGSHVPARAARRTRPQPDVRRMHVRAVRRRGRRGCPGRTAWAS